MSWKVCNLIFMALSESYLLEGVIINIIRMY